jgi:hypothetical protein
VSLLDLPARAMKIIIRMALAAAVFFGAAFCLRAEQPVNSSPQSVTFIPDPSLIPAAQAEKAVPPPRELAAIGNFTAGEKGPEHLTATARGIKIYLNWDRFEKPDFYYNIYRATAQAGNFTVVNKEPVSATAFTDGAGTSLFPPKHPNTYYYKITATDGRNETGDSNIVSARAFGPLVPPGSISTISRENSITLRWEAPESYGDNPVSAYNIFRGTAPASGLQITKTAAGSILYEDNNDGTGLTKGARYYYWLQSLDTKGFSSPFSMSISAVPYAWITSPRNVTTIAASSESIKLLWDEPESQGTYGISGYNIYRSSDASAFPAEPINEHFLKPYPDEKGKLFYFDNVINSADAPAPGTQYYYKIVPIDTEGNSGLANVTVTAKIEFMKIEKSGILSYDISQYGLPPDSNLKLSGKKSLSLTLTQRWWDHPDKSLHVNPSLSPTIDQPLKLDLNGNIGAKIFVDINYDDSKAAVAANETQKISIMYKGDKEDTLQEMSFGDISLDLSSTHYIRPLVSLFGLKGRASFLDDRLKLMLGWAQSKGITEVQTFRGTLREQQQNGSPGIVIADTSFYKAQYYYLTRATDPSAGGMPGLVPFNKDPTGVVPGSVKISIDYGNALSYDANSVPSKKSGGGPGAFKFNPQILGADFTVDYQKGIIKFNKTIASTYTIAVAYETNAIPGGFWVGYNAAHNDIDLTDDNLLCAVSGITDNQHHVIKDYSSIGNTATQISHMVMNYYYMGATQIHDPADNTSFDIKVYNSSGNEIQIAKPWDSNSPNYYTIDPDQGTLKFAAFYPFVKNAATSGQDLSYSNTALNQDTTIGSDADAYNLDTAQVKSNYTIKLFYKYNIGAYKLDNFPVVAGSERIVVDGRQMKKDKDYQIIYETGDIVFTSQLQQGPTITSDTNITVYYEYSPFIQTYESSVYGGNIDYALFDNLKVGGTFLNKSATQTTAVPDARSTNISLSTPYSGLIGDLNTSFNLTKDNLNFILSSLPLIGKTDIPVTYKFDGEKAWSDLNANTYNRTYGTTTEKGVAMIDSFEGADNTRPLSTDPGVWFPAAMPLDTDLGDGSGLTTTARAYVTKDSYLGTGHAPTTSSATGISDTTAKTIMKFNFNNLTTVNWDAYRCVVSQAGESWHNFNYMEMWIKVTTSAPIRINVDVGIISEDSNGNGVLDTEDTNNDGQLDYGEKDSGIGNGIFPANALANANTLGGYWGDNDNKVDTEDMNNNGKLDITEQYYRYSVTAMPGFTPHSELQFQGGGQWVNIRIPLNQNSGYNNVSSADQFYAANNQFLSMVKHVRLTFLGTSTTLASGAVELETLQFVGNSWAVSVQPNEADAAGNPIIASDASKLKFTTISKNSNPNDYTPNVNFFDYSTDADKTYEQSMDINYTLSKYDIDSYGQPVYYITKPLNSSTGTGYDYSAYKYLKMDVFYKHRDPNSSILPGRIVFLRVGSNTGLVTSPTLVPQGVTVTGYTDYFQYTEMLDNKQVINDDGQWHTIKFRLDGSDKKRAAIGNPNLSSITLLTLGFMNPNSQDASEEFYIDNIRLTDPQERQGSATYLSQVFDITGIASITHSYEDRDIDFDMSEDITKSQAKLHHTGNSVRITPAFIPFLSGLYYDYQNSRDYIEDKYKIDPSYIGPFNDSDREAHSGYFSLNFIPGVTASTSASYSKSRNAYYGLDSLGFDRSYLNNTDKKLDIVPAAKWTLPQQLIFIPLGINSIDTSFEFTDENLQYDYSVYRDIPNTTAYTYQPYWDIHFKQRYRWDGSWNLFNIMITPSYEYGNEKAKGAVTGIFAVNSYTTNVINYSDSYLDLRRDILPALSIKFPEFAGFTPNISWNMTNRMDYTQGQLNTTGKLELSTGAALSKLWPKLPDISSYSVSVDVNETYNKTYDPAGFDKYRALDFERKWYVFLWQMIYKEGEMRQLEDISYNGTITLTHSLRLNEIKFGDNFSISPYGTYTKTRPSQGKTLMEPKESWYLNLDPITVMKITIPALEFLVKDQKLTATYSYRKDMTKNPLDLRDITNNTDTHNATMSLLYATPDNIINGNMGMVANGSKTKVGEVIYWNYKLMPSLTLNYTYKQVNPITLWDWIPFIGGKVIKFEQNLNLNSTLSVSFDRGVSAARVETSTVTYSGSVGGNYNILQNLTARANVMLTVVHDNVLEANSYKELSVSVSGEFEF